jgi:ketosteroid isomerase-like protein
MTATNCELARAIVEDWQRGDYTAMDWADPDIVFSIVDGPAPGTWRGRDEMARAWAGFLGSWQDFQGGSLEDLREVDAERVLVLHGFYGRGRASGLEIEQSEAATIFRVRDGRVTELRVYFDRDRAEEDLRSP